MMQSQSENAKWKEQKKHLKEMYYDPSQPAGLGSIAAFAAAAKVPVAKTKKWLTKQPTYALHRRALKRHLTRNYCVINSD